MPVPLPPAGSASSSAFTSLRGRPTTARKCFRSGSPLASFTRRQRPQRQVFSHDQQRLLRAIQVEQPTVQTARKELIASDIQRQRATLADGFVQPDAKHFLQRSQQTPQPRHRESPPP